MKKIILSTIILLVSLQLLSAQEYKAPENTKFQIIGYVPSWKDPDLIPDHTLRMMDIVCYSFATIDSTGLPRLANPERLKALTKRAHKLGVKVMISFNGNHKHYAKMVSSAQSREAFVDAIWGIVKKYKLQGVDNDWEYPKFKDGSGAGNLELMKLFSQKCRSGKRQYLLTAAITPGKYIGDATAGISDEVFDLVDWFNVMIYDDYSETIHGMHHSTFDLMVESMNYWINVRGLSPSKFVAGLPAYGVPSGIKRSGNTKSYSQIIREGGSVLGDQTMVSSRNNPEAYPIYYNGISTIEQKTRHAQQNKLGGIMFWEVFGDRHDDLSLIRAAAEQAGRDVELKSKAKKLKI